MKNKKEAFFFIDGQNLFLSSKKLYGYQHPNFDVVRLCENLAKLKDATVGKISFYSGMPGQSESPHWHEYWLRRMDSLRKQGVEVFNPPIKYRFKQERQFDGQMRNVLHGSEKGVDVKLAIDMFKQGIKGGDYIVVLSQDNDLSVAANEIQNYAIAHGKSVEICSAFPTHGHRSTRGIEGTIWLPMSKEFYDANIDPIDYRTESMKRIHEVAERKLAMSDPHNLLISHGNHRLHRNLPDGNGETDMQARRRAEFALKVVENSSSEKSHHSHPKRN